MTNYEVFLEALCEVRTQYSTRFSYFMMNGVIRFSYLEHPDRSQPDDKTLEVAPNWYKHFQRCDPSDLILLIDPILPTFYELAVVAYLKVYGEGT